MDFKFLEAQWMHSVSSSGGGQDCWEVDDALKGNLELTTCKFKNIKAEASNMNFLSTLAYLPHQFPLIAAIKTKMCL